MIRSRSAKLKLSDKEPDVLPSNVPFFDAIVAEKTKAGTGVPTNSWIILAGLPGSGKTSLGIQLLNGFGQNPNVETLHWDKEAGEFRTNKSYKDLHVTHIQEYDELTKDILPVLEARIKKLATEGKILVALLDSFDALVEDDSHDVQKKISEQLRDWRRDYKNFILITVNHMNKQKQVAGVSQVQRNCDVVLLITKDKKTSKFRRVTIPKNRFTVDDSADELKLTLDPKQGIVESKEPDFVTDNPIVQGFRSLGRFVDRWATSSKK